MNIYTNFLNISGSLHWQFNLFLQNLISHVEDNVFMLKKAISKGDIKTVEKLLDNGEYCRNTYIFLKAKFKYLMSIKAIFLFILNTLVFALFFKGMDVETRLGFGWSLLMCAVNMANYDLAKLLLERGASANFSKGEIFWIALFESCGKTWYFKKNDTAPLTSHWSFTYCKKDSLIRQHHHVAVFQIDMKQPYLILLKVPVALVPSYSPPWHLFPISSPATAKYWETNWASVPIRFIWYYLMLMTPKRKLCRNMPLIPWVVFILSTLHSHHKARKN